VKLTAKSHPRYKSQPFQSREVNIHSPENSIWNQRYGLKIPVLHIYELSDDQVSSGEKHRPLNSAEKLFWDDNLWRAYPSSWRRRVLYAIDFTSREPVFNEADDMVKWVWN
jgi:hypothetical protein